MDINTVFYKVIHNKFLFNYILNLLSYECNDRNENKAIYLTHSCKWLIANGYKKTLKHKIINNHYLILDNNSMSKELEMEFFENGYDGSGEDEDEEDDGQEINQQNDNDNNDETKEKQEKEQDEKPDEEPMIDGATNKKDVFEILFKYFQDETDTQLYTSIVNRYNYYFQENVFQRAIIPAIKTDNLAAFQTIVNEFNIGIELVHFSKSIQYKSFNILNWIMGSHYNTTLNTGIWECIYNSFKPNTSTELESMLNFFSNCNGDFKNVNFNKPSLSSNLFGKCPFELNVSIKTLINSYNLINELELNEIINTKNGLKSNLESTIKSIKSSEMDINLSQSDTVLLNNIKNLIEYYLFIGNGNGLTNEYSKYLLNCKYLNKLQNNDQEECGNIINSLMYGNFNLFYNNTINKSNSRSFESTITRQIINYFLTNKKSTLLFKHCKNISNQSQFIIQMSTYQPLWSLFCLVVEYDDLELVKLAFDKFKIQDNFCVNLNNKQRKKQRIEISYTDEDGDEDQIYQLLSDQIPNFKNIYSFVKSPPVLDFISSKRFTEKGQCDFKNSTIQQDFQLFQHYQSIILNNNHQSKIEIPPIRGCLHTCNSFNLELVRYIIENESNYKIRKDPNENNIILLSLYNGLEITDKDITNFKMIVDTYQIEDQTTDTRFQFTPPDQLSLEYSFTPNYYINQNHVNLYLWILDNFSRFVINQDNVKLMIYYSSSFKSHYDILYTLTDNIITLDAALRNGDFNFIEKYINTNFNDTNFNKVQFFKKLLFTSTRFTHLKIIKYVYLNYPQFISPAFIKLKLIPICKRFNYFEIINYFLTILN